MADAPTERRRDVWAELRATTTARIGLARCGDALRTRDLLAFQRAHAAARDAVHTPLDVGVLSAALPEPAIVVRSQAPDRATYLRRPDLGRRLDPACRNLPTGGEHDAVFVIADGLSATAVQRHAAPLLAAARRRLETRRPETWRLAPTIVALEARVALGDEIASRVGAPLCAVLIGERPGLSAADSLGIYLTWDAKPGTRDSQRNCISNVHPAGLSYEAAAETLVWLMDQARARRLTGVALKDGVAVLPSDATRPPNTVV